MFILNIQWIYLIMKIFYSWQSDLNLKTNKNFIEDCIKAAIKEFNKENAFLVEFELDKDTSGEPGNPEVINTILNKIDNSRLFICDLSIVNSDYHGRKTPNPNVVFELGYAIKALGWEKIICIVNHEYGAIEDLPFDLKHRRMLSYNLIKSDKAAEKRKIVSAIKANVNILKERGLLHDEIEDYLKRDIDTEFLTIANHLSKIFLTKFDKNLLIDVVAFLHLTKEQIEDRIKNNQIIGFYLLKNFEYNSSVVKKLIDRVISISNFKKSKIVPLVKFKDWIDRYNNVTGLRNGENLFIKTKQLDKDHAILNMKSEDLPDRLILGENLENDQFRVVNFGDFKGKMRIEALIYYHQINEEKIGLYTDLINDFIKITYEWLEATGGEFILDTFKQFEIK